MSNLIDAFQIAQHCKRLRDVSVTQCVLLTDDGVKSLALGCPLLRVLKLKLNIKVFVYLCSCW